MRRIAIAIALTLLPVLPARAALPPHYQRQAELAAIINDPAIVDVFGFDGISSIEFVRTDLYRVKGGSCRLDVRIKDLPHTHPEGWAGPREFTTMMGKPVCR